MIAAAQRALELLAADSELRGVLIAGPPGIGKSTLVREFVAGRKWVRVPLGVTEDRLLGGLDFERTLATGKRHTARGLLAAADGGFLVVDDINLLDRGLAACIAHALDSREIQVEREGVSAVMPARFALIGTYNPAEGEVYAALREAVGLHVSAALGKAPLPDGRGPEECIVRAAAALGVEGHRGEIFALRAMRAGADIAAAMQFCLLPRARQLPAQAPPEAQGSERRGGAVSEPVVLPERDAVPPPGVLDANRVVPGTRGRYIRAVASRTRGSGIAIDATLRAAALHGRITPEDLRYKERKEKTGLLVIFVVDASGSMAVNRIEYAKGALLRLLGEAYLHRDQVALIAVRGKRAEIVVPPTRSVERARRAVSALAAGGGTPLASGLETARELASRMRSILVVLTDGRPNVARDPGADLWRDLASACAALRAVPSVVIDTTESGARLARLLGARYSRLEGAVYDEARALAEAARA